MQEHDDARMRRPGIFLVDLERPAIESLGLGVTAVDFQNARQTVEDDRRAGMPSAGLPFFNGQRTAVETFGIVEAVTGSNFGFPSCPATASTCGKYTQPFAQFPAHADPMGLAPLGGKLYVALFGGTGKGPEVVSMPTGGGAFTPFVTGFVAPVVALGTHGGAVYFGDLTGAVYRVGA